MNFDQVFFWVAVFLPKSMDEKKPPGLAMAVLEI
jgi:hypothetical protein